MKLDDLAKRVDEIIQMANEALKTARYDEMGGSWLDKGLFQGFRAAALSFLERTFDVKHTYYKEFDKFVKFDDPEHVKAGKNILLAVKDEIAGGWLLTVKGLVSSEILADFLTLAKESLDQSKDVAAVLACAALEDALKRVAMQKGLDVEDKDMSEVINALKANGTLKGSQTSIAKGYVKLRNKAFHAEWDKIEKPEVSSAIGFTEQFLLQHLG